MFFHSEIDDFPNLTEKIIAARHIWLNFQGFMHARIINPLLDEQHLMISMQIRSGVGEVFANKQVA